MGKKISFGLLAIAFGLLYNLYSTDLEQPKQKVMLIEHNYDSEVLWIDNKYYDTIESDSFLLENAPKGNYKFVDYKFVINQDSMKVVFKRTNKYSF